MALLICSVLWQRLLVRVKGKLAIASYINHHLTPACYSYINLAINQHLTLACYSYINRHLTPACYSYINQHLTPACYCYINQHLTPASFICRYSPGRDFYWITCIVCST